MRSFVKSSRTGKASVHRDRGVHHPSPGVSKRLATERQEAMFRLMEVF